MHHPNLFFKALGIEAEDKTCIMRLSQSTGIPLARLKYYNETSTMPCGTDLRQIMAYAGITSHELQLRMGVMDCEMIAMLQQHADQVYQIIKGGCGDIKVPNPKPALVFETQSGKLFQGDCIDLMNHLESDSIDLIFADPPFNLNKLYPSKIDDNLKSEHYLAWCEAWAAECIRLLKPGGSLFIWNLPKWNTCMSSFLNKRLTFRNWISVDIKYSLPIKGRLYPSHYSLLYYCKGEKPATFHPDRLPMPVCPHCIGDLKDYGGYKNKMNPSGVNLSDVWLDIPPVRHAKYKKRNGSNELSVKLLDRIIEMSSNEQDLVFDPFGGSGTTYSVAEIKNRKWIGVEVGPVEGIIARIKNIEQDLNYLKDIRQDLNCLFTQKNLKKRQHEGQWTPESVRKREFADHHPIQTGLFHI